MNLVPAMGVPSCMQSHTVENLQDLRRQVSSREYSRMLRHGALKHEGGIPVKYFAGINFGRARALERDEYPAQSNRYRSSSDGIEERSRGRRRLKKKKKKKSKKKKSKKKKSKKKSKKSKKSKKPKKQRKATAEEKGKAVATEECHPLTPEMAVTTLLKNKALTDQAFECLPEERQLAIARAVVAGEEVCWEQEEWEAMMSTQRSVLQEKDDPHLLSVCPPSPE
ncbi:hypothetical protein CYMTET_34044 [Cymbomonas tetramitiformis]|uniref:Uncharacterized protein n=1 Tax=Cymbomonas tetramitiformis TaxID=36881 RepID=A0AAE0FC22_9CHLO|nr:hypothetical protein CYMTET_34044 [Cymbomonas tetramitiformis]